MQQQIGRGNCEQQQWNIVQDTWGRHRTSLHSFLFIAERSRYVIRVWRIGLLMDWWSC